MSPTTQTSPYILRFQSSSLRTNEIYNVHTGDIVFRLTKGEVYCTVPIDHGGLIGVKNTCVIRQATFLVDPEGVEVASVQWRAGVATSVTIAGRDLNVPVLHREAGFAMDVKSMESGSKESDSLDGISEESTCYSWELKDLGGTWAADEKCIALVDEGNEPIAYYAHNADDTPGHALFWLGTAPEKAVEAIVTLLAVEAARRKTFGVGPLDTESRPLLKRTEARRSTMSKLFVAFTRRSCRS